MNKERLEGTIYDIMNLLEKNGQDIDYNVCMVLAAIKEYCTDHGIVCNDCPFYINDQLKCCFRSGAPEEWVFKEGELNDKYNLNGTIESI